MTHHERRRSSDRPRQSFQQKSYTKTHTHRNADSGHLAPNEAGKILEGVLSTTGKGVGFVAVEGREEDIVVPKGKLNRGLRGDTVKVKLLYPRPHERQEGEVVEIVKEGKRRFVGTLRKENGTMLLIPDDQRMYIQLEVPEADQTKEGFKALADLVSWPDPDKNPKGQVLEVIGPKGEHETEMRSIILSKGIEYDFPADVEKEAHMLKERAEATTTEELLSTGRRDLRHLSTCTIDPVDAKDFDDALSLEVLPDGNYSVGVHIADVSHYVRPKSALDREAHEREFSVYLVDRTIPMLPEVLSNDLCSLNPHEDKLAFSGLFTITPKGEVIDRWFGKSLIHSNRRYSYEDAQHTLDTGEGDMRDELVALNTLAKILRKERFANGAIDFAEDEVKFELDDEGKPLRVIRKQHLDTHRLIEEFMLLCNKEVALKIFHLSQERGQEELFIYRTHDVPDREKLEELAVFLRALGYEFVVGKEVDPKELNALLASIKGKAEEGLVNTALIRSMSKAQYSTLAKGHFGLAFKHYTHFTSPIRRYPDLLAHRLLFEHLNGIAVSRKEWGFYEAAARDASKKEIEVLEAERESIKYKQVEFLKDRIGEVFNGVITGVSEYGLYVEEKETKASGLVRIRTLGNEYFKLDEKTYALVGSTTGTRYTLGDHVKVKLTNADLDRKQLDFEIAKEA